MSDHVSEPSSLSGASAFLNGDPGQSPGFVAQKNFLLNVTEYVRRQLPPAWAGALRGLPAFVCGSGPSLDVSAAALAAAADRGVVLAADSALRALARYDVVADFAVSVSPCQPAALCLAPEAAPRRVILSTVSPVSWREAIAPDRRYFLSRPHPTEDWLVEQGVARTPVLAVDDCGLTELELARFLGCAPIHLFGFDYPIAGARASDHHNAGTDPAPTSTFRDWQEYDARLATWPRDLVIDVNDRGARLRGTRLIHPRQFVGPAGGPAKRPMLAQLAPPVGAEGEAARRAFAAIGAQGARGCRLVTDLRSVLVQQGGAAMAAELRRVCLNHEFARMLGPFVEVILPPAPVADDAFWRAALDECEELCCLAEAVYGAAID